MEKLGVSWATLKRDLAYLKDRLHAPIIFDRELGGYRFENQSKKIGPQCTSCPGSGSRQKKSTPS